MNQESIARFNRKNIQDRQIDTLIGFGKGIIADGVVTQSEADSLLSWLQQNQQTIDNPIIDNLLDKVYTVLEDGILDAEEATELLVILESISGEKSETGELAKTSKLPINNPPPPITFEGKSFLFTGTCAYGTRKQCQEAINSLRGINVKGVTKTLNYLVLGTYVSDSWAHETFGRKIEMAVEYRENGIPLVIVTEEHWANEAGL